MLTPPLETIASHIGGGRAQDPLELGLVVADRAEVDHLTPGLGEQPGEHRAVALADLPGCER